MNRIKSFKYFSSLLKKLCLNKKIFLFKKNLLLKRFRVVLINALLIFIETNLKKSNHNLIIMKPEPSHLLTIFRFTFSLRLISSLRPRVIFFNFQARMLGEAGLKIGQKNIILIILDPRLIWNSNLKLNFDQERESKIEKKSQNSKNNRVKI